MKLLRYLIVLLFFVAGFMPTAGFADPIVSAPSVALGSDYFQTDPNTTHFDFGGPIGVVYFMGVPVGPGLTDTIVQRKADATINGAPIPIQIVMLSMESTAPVNIGGSFFDVFVTLDPAQLANDTGQIQISGGLTGGNFSSTLNVFFVAHFAPTGVGSAFDVPGQVVLSQSGASWGPTPNGVIVPGPDDGSTLDQAANFHTGLDPSEVDFFVTGSLVECTTGLPAECHGVHTPEPGTVLLLAGGLLMLAARGVCKKFVPRV